MFSFHTDAQAFSNAFFGMGTSTIYLDSVQCSGSEVDLLRCPYSPGASCGQADNAGVQCRPTRKITDDTAIELYTLFEAAKLTYHYSPLSEL